MNVVDMEGRFLALLGKATVLTPVRRSENDLLA
jgi:hypothetical protein